MGGGDIPKVPDWRSIKIADFPLAVKYQQQLAENGLKDPWIRNHLFKFRLMGDLQKIPFHRRMWYHGHWQGFGAAVVFIVGVVAYDKLYGGDSGHH